MNQRHHARTGSQSRKVLPPHARPVKPPVLRRGTSYNNGSAHHSHSHSHSAARSATSRKAEEEEEDEESGMSSFLQFCATCEKQIVTPGSTILYCSEACRRKDVSRPSSIPSIHAISPFAEPSTTTTHFPFDLPQGDIMPQRSPTVLRPLSLALSDDFGSHLDLNDDTLVSPFHRCGSSSDDPAARYLDQFSYDLSSSTSRRNHHNRASRDAHSSGLPSLVHSPSSSYGTVASNASYRPFHSRGNPFSGNSAHNTAKSIDLVLPCDISSGGQPPSPTQLLKDASLKSSASTLTSFRTVEAGSLEWKGRKDSTLQSGGVDGEDGQEKRTWRSSRGGASSTQLFCHEKMKGEMGRRS